MIHRLELRNWKAYESALIPFEPGTTFVVAPNGIGKTSLIEAARFALTGAVPAGLPVSLTSDHAEVLLALGLGPGQTLVIKRRLSADARTGELVSATLNGRALHDQELEVEIQHAFGASAEFVGANALLADGLDDLPAPNIRELLTRALNLDGKRAQAWELEAEAAQLSSRASELSKQVRAEAKATARLESDLAAARDEGEAASAAVVAAREAMDLANAQRDTLVRFTTATQRLEEWTDAAADVVRAAKELGIVSTAETVTVELERLVARAEAEVAAARVAVARIEARIEMVESSVAELDGAESDCPVCRRPLSPADREHARAEHNSELGALRSELESLLSDRADERFGDAQAVLRRALMLGARPLQPDPIDSGEDNYDAARSALEAAVGQQQRAARQIADLEAELAQAVQSLELAEESELAWRHWALASAAAETLHASIDATLMIELAPIVEAVATRWNTLFADRPNVQFDIEGKQWREIAGKRLPVEAFSTGEQTAAKLLLQLVVLTTMTKIDFCWLDEPLEHLDPQTRRLVAGMLSHGRESLGIRQVVVTTYEEELASFLARADDGTTVEYVRAGAASETTETTEVRARRV